MHVNWEHFLQTVLGSVIYCVIGLVLFGAGFLLIQKLVPFSIRREIEEDQNVALAILIGCTILGLSIIIAASISG